MKDSPALENATKGWFVVPQWEQCRRKDGSIDLREAAYCTGCKITEDANAYLEMIEKMSRITSRQVAAVAIAAALQIAART